MQLSEGETASACDECNSGITVTEGGTELGVFSIWEKDSEDTIVASLQDSNKPPYSPTTAKWDVEQLMGHRLQPAN